MRSLLHIGFNGTKNQPQSHSLGLKLLCKSGGWVWQPWGCVLQCWGCVGAFWWPKLGIEGQRLPIWRAPPLKFYGWKPEMTKVYEHYSQALQPTLDIFDFCLMSIESSDRKYVSRFLTQLFDWFVDGTRRSFFW